MGKPAIIKRVFNYDRKDNQYEKKLSIKGYEEYTTTVQIAAGEETELESKILPEIPNSDAKVITVTTEDDSEEDFNNTSVTYDDLASMEKVSLRMAANVINNDATDCWYRIEFAEGVNHIEPVNHTSKEFRFVSLWFYERLFDFSLPY